MADLTGLDLDTNEPMSGTIPAGEYLVTFVKDEPKEFGANKKLTFAFTIDDGPYAGRMIWLDFWVKHENMKCRNISVRHLRDLFLSYGMDIAQVSDTSVAHGLSCYMTISLYKEKYHNFESARAVGGSDGSPF